MVVRIQAAADFHGKQQRYRAFATEATRRAPDVVVLAGDVNGSPYFYDMLRNLAMPTLIVHGNMDDAIIGADVAANGGQFIHQKALSIEGVRFVGLGGGQPTTETIAHPTAHSKTPLSNLKIDVLVTHLPPKGSMDKMAMGRHIGSVAVRRVVDTLHPRVVICGHVHEHPGWECLNETVVVNCSVGQSGVCTLIEFADDIQVERIP
jgi:Icc-related predicted phosphoesterase